MEKQRLGPWDFGEGGLGEKSDISMVGYGWICQLGE